MKERKEEPPLLSKCLIREEKKKKKNGRGFSAFFTVVFHLSILFSLSLLCSCFSNLKLHHVFACVCASFYFKMFKCI